jgi:microcystin-dependent protein
MQPFIGEIRMFGGNFAPQGWAFCNGQLLPISENTALFALIGTTYGGDGQSTFALPNLQGRIPVHQGSGFVIGQAAGRETVPLTTVQLPSHSHLVLTTTGSPATAKSTPGGNFIADEVLSGAPSPQPLTYAAFAGANDPNQRALAASSIQSTGGNAAHDNMVPFVCVNFILSLFGIFPSQN